jgi:hypothetical protein
VDISFGYPDFHHNEKLESFNPGFVTGFMMVKKWGASQEIDWFWFADPIDLAYPSRRLALRIGGPVRTGGFS